MTNVSEMFQEFIRLEKDMNLFRRKIQGVLFWEHVRCSIFFLISGMKSEEVPSKMSKISFFERMKFHLLSFIRVNRNPFFGFRKDILFFSNARRVLRKDGRWWDIYTDYIVNQLEMSFRSIEQSISLKHRMPAKTRGLRYIDFLHSLSYILQKLNLISFSLTKDEAAFLGSLGNEIRTRFHIKMDVENFVIQRLRTRNIRVPFYQWLLRWIKPKVTIVTTDCGMEDFIEAARSLGIPVIEFQHGNISPYHPGYSFPDEHQTIRTFADYLFVFGDFWRDIATFPLDPDHIISVGFPYLEEEMRLHSTVGKKRQILVISQNLVGKTLSRFAVDLSKFPGLNYKIVYKLHPAEYKDWRINYPWLVDSEIDVVDGNVPSLYRLFAESETQLGVYSTAIYEGLAFGLRTFLLDMEETQHMQNLLDVGVVEKISSIEDFISIIEKEVDVESFNQDVFFRKDSIRNIIEAIKTIAFNRPDIE